ncbi:hypothetical protein D769_30919 [Cupriavidus sp. HMR-1]|nr:hypothetical protein D769_30919 [Cupriavidus sp. HMR-1]
MIGDARNDVAQVGLGRDRSAWLPQPTINYRARASIESRAHAHMRLVLGALRTVRRPVLERLLTHCHHLDIRLVLATLAGQLDAPWAQWVERHLAARPLSAP